MLALKIILAVILFIIVLFCIPVTVIADYNGRLKLDIQYLFLKFRVAGNPKKEKKKTKTSGDTAEKQDKEKTKPKKEKEENLFLKFYHNQSFSGVLELIKDVLNATGRMFKHIFKGIKVKHLYLDMIIAGEDSAQTAIKYGQISGAVFPAMGLICSTMKVRKYNVDISPDFLAREDTAAFYAALSIRPIALTNAVIVWAMKMIFHVLLKIIRVNNAADKEKQNEINKIRKQTKYNQAKGNET